MPPRTPKTGLIVGVVIAVVLLFVIAGVGGFYAYSAMKGRVAGTTAGTPTAAVPATTTVATPEPSAAAEAAPGATAGATSPEAAVDGWFAAVASGDLAAVKKTATADFAAAIEPGMFEGMDPQTSYRITGSNSQGGQATVDVQESPTNAPAQTATTFTLQQQADGTWLISGYQIAATGETPGTPAPAPFTKTDAIDVVGTMLNGMKTNGGSLKAAQAAATARFKRANPGWIMKASYFDFYVTGAKKKGSTWIVTTHESWPSGVEKGTYTVVVKDGKGYVDRRNGLN
jgi:hypothetical protein